MATSISFLTASWRALHCDAVIGVIITAPPWCDFSNQQEIPASSESAVHRGRRNDFLSVVLSWPADATRLRSLITHSNAHKQKTHTHTRAQTHTHMESVWIQVSKVKDVAKEVSSAGIFFWFTFGYIFPMLWACKLNGILRHTAW